MFVTVKTVKEHAVAGAKRQAGDNYQIRRQQAKILQALGKVEIVDNTESPSPSVAPKLRQAVIVPNLQTPADEKPAEEDTAKETPADAPAETPADTVDTTAPPVVDVVEQPKETKPKGRKSKYETRVMKA